MNPPPLIAMVATTIAAPSAASLSQDESRTVTLQFFWISSIKEGVHRPGGSNQFFLNRSNNETIRFNAVATDRNR